MCASYLNETTTSAMPTEGSDSDKSVSAQDQILLNALQDFLVPLIWTVVDPKELNNATYQRPEGPQSMKLLSVLKEFVSSIAARSLDSAPEEKTTIKVELDAVTDDDGKGVASVVQHVSRRIYSPGPTFRPKLLHALREYVFNKMPIRLLCINPKGSSLEISLIERGTLYTRVEERILAELDGPNYYHEVDYSRPGSDEWAIGQLISKYAGYVILSHTWLRDSPEITYGDWKNGQFNADGPGYRKLTNFCKSAWQDHELTLAWMDTLCINKDSSSELDESIRSMYAWYKRAKLCIVYLAESETLSEITHDPWFTRGWTLQELLAPDALKFYNCLWKQFAQNSNDKKDPTITNFITQATTISRKELKDIHDTPLSRRMQLAASRQVTREEDTAYSLMGIFNVSIATAYGEGAERAFFRLLQEILNSTSEGILDLLNWAGETHSTPRTTNILPPTPRHYLRRTAEVSWTGIRPLEPLALTHLGLRIPVLLLPALPADHPNIRLTSIGEYWAKATVNNITFRGRSQSAKASNTFYVLNSGIMLPPPTAVFSLPRRIFFAVFNIRQRANEIIIPPTCIAFLLEGTQKVGQVTSTGDIIKLDTQDPVVVNMKTMNGLGELSRGGEDVPVDELAKHGMQLITLYL